MNKTYFFTNGTPRSGSTLIQNILAQNPKFHATETSGLLDTLFSIRNTWDKHIEHQAAPNPDRLQNVLKGIMKGYFDDIEQNTIFVKSRGIVAYIEFLENILEQKIKILVPVRPVIDILTSFEKLYRETVKTRQPPGEAENYFQFQTVEGRCEYWLRPDQVVGLSLSRIEDSIRRGFRDRLHFIDFNRLTNNPKRTMLEVYNFLGEEWFEHNFDHVEQVTHENDNTHGFIGLHTIRNKVEPVKSRALEILGKDIVQKFQKGTSSEGTLKGAAL